MFDLIVITLVGILLLFAIYTAIQVLGRYPSRTMDDVTPFLRPAESKEFESLLDPAHEINFRLRMSSREFAEWQRKRIHLMREYLLRMSHNSLVLIEWGNMEAIRHEHAPASERHLLAEQLVQAATEFRLYSFLALAKLKLWLVLPPPLKFLLPSPSLPSLRKLFGIDALNSYHRLKSAASDLGLASDIRFHQELIARL